MIVSQGTFDRLRGSSYSLACVLAHVSLTSSLPHLSTLRTGGRRELPGGADTLLKDLIEEESASHPCAATSDPAADAEVSRATTQY